MRRILIAAIFAGVLALLTACGSSGGPFAGRPMYKDAYGSYRVTDCKMISQLGTMVPELYVEFDNTSGHDEYVTFTVNYDGMLPQNASATVSVRPIEVLASQDVQAYFTMNNPPDDLCAHDPHVIASA